MSNIIQQEEDCDDSGAVSSVAYASSEDMISPRFNMNK